MSRVAIIGFAGCHLTPSERASLTSELHSAMVDKAYSIITDVFRLEWKNVELVSGGAAWSDHVAVSLFLRAPAPKSLTIYAPCAWNASNGQFCECANANRSWKMNPARLANVLHEQFAAATGLDSFGELRRAADSGAVVNSRHFGFHERNTAIAQACDFMIAFSWAADAASMIGGTKNTWSKCALGASAKVHVDVHALVKGKRATNSEDLICTT